MKPAFAAGAALTLAMLPGCHRPPARASEADGLTPVPAARYIVARAAGCGSAVPSAEHQMSVFLRKK